MRHAHVERVHGGRRPLPILRFVSCCRTWAMLPCECNRSAREQLGVKAFPPCIMIADPLRGSISSPSATPKNLIHSLSFPQLIQRGRMPSIAATKRLLQRQWAHTWLCSISNSCSSHDRRRSGPVVSAVVESYSTSVLPITRTVLATARQRSLSESGRQVPKTLLLRPHFDASASQQQQRKYAQCRYARFSCMYCFFDMRFSVFLFVIFWVAASRQ